MMMGDIPNINAGTSITFKYMADTNILLSPVT